MKIILETARLTLREMSLADLDFIAAMLADPHVMRFYPKQYSRSEAEAWLARRLGQYEKHGHSLWLVQDKTTGEPRGQVGLIPQLVEGCLEPEIGYLIHYPFWRQGLASEAAAGVRDYAFQVLKKPYVISLIRPENTPSQGVARKLGMTPVREVMHADLKHLVFKLESGASEAG